MTGLIMLQIPSRTNTTPLVAMVDITVPTDKPVLSDQDLQFSPVSLGSGVKTDVNNAVPPSSTNTVVSPTPLEITPATTG